MFKEKQIAEEINRVMLNVSKKLDESAFLVANSSCSTEEKAGYIKTVGKILGIIGIDVLNNIYRCHPDLKPQEYLLPEDFNSDGNLTPDEEKLVAQLTDEEIRGIDQSLLVQVRLSGNGLFHIFLFHG